MEESVLELAAFVGLSCGLAMVVKFQAEVGKPGLSGFSLWFAVSCSPVILSFLSSSLLYEVSDGRGNPANSTVCVGPFLSWPSLVGPSDMNAGFCWKVCEGSIDEEMKQKKKVSLFTSSFIKLLFFLSSVRDGMVYVF